MAVLTFVSVLGAALLGLFSKTRLPSEQPLRDDTSIVVRLVANLFVLMTGLVLGLMLNSAKNSLETNNRNIRALQGRTGRATKTTDGTRTRYPPSLN